MRKAWGEGMDRLERIRGWFRGKNALDSAREIEETISDGMRVGLR